VILFGQPELDERLAHGEDIDEPATARLAR